MRLRITIMVAVLLLARLAGAAPGDLDPTFGSGGEVAVLFPPVLDAAPVDAVGRIVVAGLHQRKPSDVPQVVVRRYDADGAADPTFGTDGFAIVVPERPPAVLHAVTLAPDGRPIVAVETAAPGRLLIVTRLTSAGAIDATFGTSGSLVVPLDGPSQHLMVVDLLAHADGAFTVAALDCNDELTRCALVLVHATADGVITATMRTKQDLESPVDAHAVLDPDGRIVLAIRVFDGAEFKLLLARYDPDGRLDRGFGKNGRLLTAVPMSRFRPPLITRDPDGRYLVVGADLGYAVIARFEADGTPDRDFGTNGRTRVVIGDASEIGVGGLAVRPDGRIVLAGGAGIFRLGAGWYVAVLDPTGAFDPAFGTEGIVLRTPGELDGAAGRVLLQPDGRTVVVGLTIGGTLARYEGFSRACGDANGDDTLSVTDGVQVLRAAAGVPSLCLVEFCDVDGNGAVTVTDGVRTLRAAAALPVALECAP